MTAPISIWAASFLICMEIFSRQEKATLVRFVSTLMKVVVTVQSEHCLPGLVLEICRFFDSIRLLRTVGSRFIIVVIPC